MELTPITNKEEIKELNKQFEEEKKLEQELNEDIKSSFCRNCKKTNQDFKEQLFIYQNGVCSKCMLKEIDKNGDPKNK